MNVLVVNAGSSSLKYQLFDMETEEVIAKGICERIGMDGIIEHKVPGRDTYKKQIEMKTHEDATEILVKTLTDPQVGVIKSMDEISAVGHRIVHGGAFFSKSILVSDDVIAKLEQCYDFAPLHTGAHLMGIRGCLAAMPGKPQVLVFDTAFHQTMPEEAYIYPIPYEMYEKYHIRRYGAHGTSHRFVAGEMAKILGKPIEETKIVTCHLGNGSSISAVDGGKVVDTSMGFTPLAGVEMGTRCGDIDPAIVTYLMDKEGYTPAQMSEFMNKKCGILGVSGVSSDARDIEKAVAEGNPRALLAFKILAHQIKKYIGGYAAVMNGLDAVVFTAGLGENTTQLRSLSCEGMEWCGIKFDEAVNQTIHRPAKTTCLSTADSKVKVYLIPTNEELVIARDTKSIAEAL